MLKYSGNTINDWNYGASNLIKVYRNNAIVYYKVSGESPTPEYKVCFAVVDDITQYQETEFEDVYDKATEKWYKLNNLNQYEEYGVYGSGRTICSAASFTELTDIIAQSTTALTNHNITVTPAVGAFSKIRIDTTKSATTTSYCWTTFTPTPSGSEVLGINLSSIGAMNGYGNNKNYVTDANGSQTFAHWVDDNNTIVEIDIAALSNNQTSELYLLFYQENCNPAAFSFYIKPSRLPQGYTEVEYVENTSTAYINTEVLLYDSTTNSYEIETKMSSTWGGGEFEYLLATEGTSSPYNGLELRWNTHYQSGGELQCESVPKNVAYSNVDNGDGTSAITISCTSTNATNNVPLSLFCGIWSTGPWRNGRGKIYSFKVTKNNTLVKDLVPCKRDSDDKYGMYDLITDTFYVSPNNIDFSGGEPITPTDCVTTYNGKLTIDDGYEYEWNGSSWVNVGEVSGSSKSSGFTSSDIGESGATSGFSDGDYVIISYKNNNSSTTPSCMMSYKNDGTYDRVNNFSGHTGSNTLTPNTIIDAAVWKFEGTATADTYYIKNVENELYWGYQDTNTSRSFYLVDDSQKAPILIDDYDGYIGLIEKKYLATSYFGGYGLNQLYGYTYQLGWLNSGTGSEANFYTTDGNALYALYKVNGGTTEYPKYYSEKSDPLNDLTFNTLAEAQAYAYNNCVYDGMKATIDGDRYYFDSEDENGWVKILEYYKVEDVTPSGGSGWTISGSSRYNPDSTYYDDFDLETTSTSNVTKIAKVTIYGYDHFTYYLRSYHGYSGAHGYVMSTNVDEIQTPPASMSYDSSSAITTTYYWNKSPKSAVNLSNYRRVTYNNLDKTVEHTFYVYFYGRTYSSYVGNATILIPKEQTNENWEQVTFSSSTNVSRTTKSLYIDGNYSNSGGTQYWYYRWIVGLPSGSHSSSVSYNSYNYCPNVTSSTFTSVAGEQRQVNFTYDGTTDKSLSFRLTDGSNVLTPSDTVYYNIAVYNSCGVSSSSSNVTFPRSLSVKVGGSFSFSNSSNRHYIYGYQPPTLGTRYYVDNYQSTFDIVYTKLSEEAVTIAYTAYDPNDSEIPAFNTDITYPYNGGTTSSTTLTSFDVPYTYPYEVSQTNDKFSADSQSYTANQTARTISFVLYPNNREFATVADLEAYQYAWEGMKATVGDTKYQYKNGEWVENQHSLPDVPFVLNYNAKQYDATTYTIAMTDGQLNGTDAIAYTNPNNIVDHSSDGYITISNSSMRIRKENQDIALFNRSSNSTSSDLTIVCKAKSTGGENIITNRDGNYNWMYRLKTGGSLRFHGTSETGSISWNRYNPDIMSVRTYYDNGTKLKYNNWTQNTSTTPISFTYGSTNGDTSKAGALFVGYSWSNTNEQWSGDFYWVYMAQANLTDEQIQQVIDYNENL